MTENQSIPEAGTQPLAQPTMSFPARLVGIYFEPQKTFEDIDKKPSWLGIFIIICAFIVSSSYVLTTRMDHETFMRKALQMNPLTRNLSEEQIKTIVAQPRSAFQKYSQYVFAPVGALLVYLIIAGVFLLVYVLMGASITYKKTLAITIWGMAPPGIILSILGIIFMFIKDPETLDLNSANNVASNPGLLVASKEHPVLASLLGSIDLFSFWTIYLLALGFTIISGRKLTMGKSAAAIVGIWLIYVFGKAGIAAIFG